LWHGWKRAELATVFAFVAVGLLLYSRQLYPYITPAMGGGLPTEVTLFLSEKGPLGVPNTRIEAKLLEEVEQGYYLQPTNGNIAYFVPRSAISAVQFAREP
jgi:hypothetical protein